MVVRFYDIIGHYQQDNPCDAQGWKCDLATYETERSHEFQFIVTSNFKHIEVQKCFKELQFSG